MITTEHIRKATQTLLAYKQGKTNLERRIVEDELWWELRHWEAMDKTRQQGPRPTSAWLFNAILNKHADAMDSYPEPVVLPREQSDRQSAQILSQVLPVVLEYNQFEDTYAKAWWEKLKHGTCAYGVFWNPQKDNLGDLDIREIDLLRLFWEPGITDLQDSRNLFIVDLVDEDILDSQYPEYRGKWGNAVDVKQYSYDDHVDVSGKKVVVDWYYKAQNLSGKTVLHLAKFVGDNLLFASENLPQYQETGWYAHGKYPIVLDVMFPEKGTPVGFGYVAVTKDPQAYIDKLFANILENSIMATKKRFFISGNTTVNEDEFLDWNRPLVHVEGELDSHRIQEIVTRPLDNIYMNVAQMKIEELKDTSANRDVNAGSTPSGVTAASAIAALQEAGNKVSRDMIAASYRAHTAITTLCLELIAQFYDEGRAFRIVADQDYQFVTVDKSLLGAKPTATLNGETLYRRPVFDIKVKAQKQSAYSRLEQNEHAKELYRLGFFAPERAREALLALEMMDFEGIAQVRAAIASCPT